MTDIDPSLVTRIVEAALLAANQPLALVQLKGLFPLDEPAPDGSVEAALEQLAREAAQRRADRAGRQPGHWRTF